MVTITSDILYQILYEFMYIGALLIIGTLLRAKIPLFQNLYLPASVLGGMAGLLLGPSILNISPIPGNWISDMSAYPGILIIPIIAAAPLGIHLPTRKEFANSVGPHFIVATSIVFFQLGIGVLIGGLCCKYMPSLWPTFGLEGFAGFWGGHATAGLLGNTLKGLGLSYWEDAQGVCVTVATLGIISGIVGGTILINWAARKNYTTVLKKPGDIPPELKRGYISDPAMQPSLGRTTVLPESINTVAFHMACILSVCGIAFLVSNMLTRFSIPILQDFSVWLWALLLMLAVWIFMVKCKLDWLIDKKVVSHCTSLLMEFAVCSAIVSLPLKSVMAYIGPIIILSITMFLSTVIICVIPLGVRFLPDPWFECGIATYGQSCGVFMTGALLLRIADPDNKTDAISSFSLSFALCSLVAWPYFAIAPNIILSYGSFTFAAFTLGIYVLLGAAAIIFRWIYPPASKRIS
ncbi:MAG: glutamate:sodium symporter [Clostridia bacterium]|nr:glutamate:sodium symporter [Clostridia bacterium]